MLGEKMNKRILNTDAPKLDNQNDLSALFRVISAYYKNAQIVGFLVVIGGWISAALLVTAAFQVFKLEEFEFYSLTALSAVFIVCGCFLFGYLEHLRLKWYIARKNEKRERSTKGSPKA
jgi:hypothetical protein